MWRWERRPLCYFPTKSVDKLTNGENAVEKLLILGFFGLVAQLVDGTLGMAYGVTTTTLLLTAGAAPALASATVHLAEVGTTLASGTAHWRFGNVDWRTVGLMAAPGAIGAFVGAVVLSSLSAEVAEPWVAAILFFLGGYILVRFSRRREAAKPDPAKGPRLRAVFLSPLGALAGLIDAMGGGGWGPIASAAWSPHRSPPGWFRSFRRACSARPWEVSSSSQTPRRSETRWGPGPRSSSPPTPC